MHAKIYDSLFEYGRCNSLVKNLIAIMSVLHFLQFIFAVICEDILMRCAANSIFDCAGVLKCTPSNQIIDVCKQVAK